LKFTYGSSKAARRFYIRIFGIGMLLGILLMNLGKSILLENTGLFDEHTLYHMKNVTVDSDALFVYVLGERAKFFLFLIVATTTYLGLIICRGVMIWYGVSAGAFVTALTLRYGLKGILLAAVSVFPQYLLYGPAILALLLWCEEMFREIYCKGEAWGNFEKRDNVKRFGQLLKILILVMAGSFLEGYFNAKLLMGFLQVF